MRLRVDDRRAAPGAAIPARWLTMAPALAESLGLPGWEAALTLVDDAQMAELNRAHRGVDGPTDVLSFAGLATTGDGPPALAEGQAHAAHDLWRADWETLVGAEIGELVVAPGYVAARCREHGWPLVEELALLTVHGLLHLLGWEHADEAATRAMRSRETELLAEHGLAHPLGLEGGAAD